MVTFFNTTMTDDASAHKVGDCNDIITPSESLITDAPVCTYLSKVPLFQGKVARPKPEDVIQNPIDRTLICQRDKSESNHCKSSLQFHPTHSIVKESYFPGEIKILNKEDESPAMLENRSCNIIVKREPSIVSDQSPFEGQYAVDEALIKIESIEMNMDDNLCTSSSEGPHHDQMAIFHMTVETSDDVSTTDIFDDTLTNSNPMTSGIKILAKPYLCPKCFKAFSSVYNMRVHQRRHCLKSRKLLTSRKIYDCEFCYKGFAHGSSLIVHRRIHTGEKPFLCNQCPLSFSDKSNFLRHRLKHSGEIDVTCPICSKHFSQKCSRDRHIRRGICVTTGGERSQEVPPMSRKFRCNQCPKMFCERSRLITHLRVHSGERPFECLSCGKSFADRSNFTRHVKHHVTPTECNCPKCGTRFTQRGSLNRHLLRCGMDKEKKPTRTPSIPKPLMSKIKHYLCEICGKSFTDPSNFNRHNKIHAGFKAYRCEHCPKAFIQKSDLQKHIRVHFKAKVYTCRRCCIKFQKKELYLEHKKAFHKRIKRKLNNRYNVKNNTHSLDQSDATECSMQDSLGRIPDNLLKPVQQDSCNSVLSSQSRQTKSSV